MTIGLVYLAFLCLNIVLISSDEDDYRFYPRYTTAPSISVNRVESGQCSCIKNDFGTNQWCVAYNEEYQAEALQDALFNFADPSLSNDKYRASINPVAVSNGNGRQCYTDKCRKCARYVLDNIQQSVMRCPDNTFCDMGFYKNRTIGQVNQLYSTFGADRITPGTHDCAEMEDRIGHRKLPPNQSKQIPTPDEEAAMMGRFRGNGGGQGPPDWTQSQGQNQGNGPVGQPSGRQPGPGGFGYPGSRSGGKSIGLPRGPRGPSPRDFWEWDSSGNPPKEKGRNRRQTTTVSPPEYVNKIQIRCQDKGTVVSTDSSNVALCGFCWEWGELPEDYYPRYVNQISCTNDNQCLSGYGDCTERYRSVDVLKKQGTEWIPYTLNVPVSCECQVSSFSTFFNLVIG